MSIEAMKACTKCKANKIFSEFSKMKTGKFGLRSWCKSCDSKEAKKWQSLNKDKAANTSKDWYEKNKTTASAAMRNWYQENKLKKKTAQKAWAVKNKDKVNASIASRKAKKLTATPDWANKEKISVIYEYAKLCTLVMKKSFHVDHIVPLVSTKVCGLHVEKNLQVLEASQNILKKNHHWPDMWQKDFVCQ
jgi:uncharacterized protein YbcC (UPF0753/DUF2309 family)